MNAVGRYIKWSAYGAVIETRALPLGDMAYALRNYPNTRTRMTDGSRHIRCECGAYSAIIIEITKGNENE